MSFTSIIPSLGWRQKMQLQTKTNSLVLLRWRAWELQPTEGTCRDLANEVIQIQIRFSVEEITGGSDCCGIMRLIAEKAYTYTCRGQRSDDIPGCSNVACAGCWIHYSVCPTAAFNSLVPLRSRCEAARRGSFTLANVCTQLKRAT